MLGLAPARVNTNALTTLPSWAYILTPWGRGSAAHADLPQTQYLTVKALRGGSKHLWGGTVMKRLLVVVSCCSAFLLLATTQSAGCGDKVLALGRAVKLRYVSAHLASILVYERSGSPGAAAISDP